MTGVGLLPLRALVEAHREEIKAIVSRHKGIGVALFGSVARGEETAASDVDLLVEFAPGASLFDLVRMQSDFEALLRRSVDVASRGGLLPEDDDILRDAIPL